MAIFQSKIQAKLMYENISDLLVDGMFYSIPKGVYQVIITRVALENHHKFFISYTLALNKDQETYKAIFNKINILYNINNNKKHDL